MKVAHILRKYNPVEWGGTETALQRLFQGFSGLGVDSVVYAPRLQRNPESDPFTQSGCLVRRFQSCLPVLGIPRLERQQEIAVGGNLISFQLPIQLAREPGVEIIHTHALGRLGGIGRRMAQIRRVPLVVTIHGGALDLPPALQKTLNSGARRGLEWGKLFGPILGTRHLLDTADAILTCNPREASLLRDRYPRQRIQVQPHGVDLPSFSQDHRTHVWKEYPEWRDRQIILCLGRVDAVKNQLWLIEQSRPVLEAEPTMQLVLVGSCTNQEYGARLESRLKEIGMEHRVTWLKGLPPRDPRLIGLLQAARLLVLPSLSETFGLVLLESWAAGTAVASSRTSGGSALVRHGENGWLFDLERPDDFREILRQALHCPDRVRAMAEAGWKVAKEYDVHAIAAEVRQLYQDLIDEKKTLRDPARR